jgi:DNA polymerase-1
MAKCDILIDGHHLAHRVNHVFQSLQTSSFEPVGLVYGFLKTLLGLKQRFKNRDCEFFVFWDSRPVVKISIFPEYKAQRKKKDVTLFYNQLSKLRRVLVALGLVQIQVEQEEADDLISSYVCQNRGDKKFIILTADRDYLQLVAADCTMFKPKMGKHPEILYTPAKVFEEFSLSPEAIVFLKVFCGDSSDNIPGVSRLPKKQVVKILDQVELDGILTIDHIYAQLDSFDFLTKNQHTKIENFQEEAYRNYELIKLKEHLDVSFEQVFFDAESLKEHFIRLEFTSFIKSFADWRKLFEPSSVPAPC